jgi:hypothetical protein
MGYPICQTAYVSRSMHIYKPRLSDSSCRRRLGKAAGLLAALVAVCVFVKILRKVNVLRA